MRNLVWKGDQEMRGRDQRVGEKEGEGETTERVLGSVLLSSFVMWLTDGLCLWLAAGARCDCEAIILVDISGSV